MVCGLLFACGHKKKKKKTIPKRNCPSHLFREGRVSYWRRGSGRKNGRENINVFTSVQCADYQISAGTTRAFADVNRRRNGTKPFES